MALNFESVVSNYWEKLVTGNWFKIQRHLPTCGVNVTSEFLGSFKDPKKDEKKIKVNPNIFNEKSFDDF